MTQDLYLALLKFAFVTTVTPGPNNMMLLASGVNFGARRTLPHMFGITFGVVVMVLLVGFGVAGIFKLWPPSLTVLKILSVAYMLWLAWKIATSSAPGKARSDAPARPMTFLQAAAFQWVNPKAWAMVLGGISAYVPNPTVPALFIAASAFALVSLPSISLWAIAGQTMRRWLDDPNRLRLFNWTMAALLILSLWPVLAMEFHSP